MSAMCAPSSASTSCWTGTWYRLRFSAVGTTLTLYVDDVPQLQVTDGTFSWGTSGIRTDHATVYIDDWTVR
jgi:hypothetical protein